MRNVFYSWPTAHWRVSSSQGRAYDVVLLSDLPRRFDRVVDRLLQKVPGATWDAERSRDLEAVNVRTIVSGVPHGDSIDLTLVIVENGRVLGVLRAYEANSCLVRTKEPLGLGLLEVGNYINIGPSALHPSIRRSGLYSQVYGLRVDLIRLLLAGRASTRGSLLLTASIGMLKVEMAGIYESYPRRGALIPRDAFSDEAWRSLGRARPTSRPAEVLALRYGFRPIGFKKSDGGPVRVLRVERWPLCQVADDEHEDKGH